MTHQQADRLHLMRFNREKIEWAYLKALGAGAVMPVIYVLDLDDKIGRAIADNSAGTSAANFKQRCPAGTVPTAFVALDLASAKKALALHLKAESVQKLTSDIYLAGMFYVVCIAAGGTTISAHRAPTGEGVPS
jgi:hypothetical protein